MDSAINGFVRALRAAGAAVSTVETLDAARTVALLGWSDRAVLRDAFGLVLAKSEDDKVLHDRVFDTYFALPAPTSPDDHAEQPAPGTEPASTAADSDNMAEQFELERAAQAAGVDGIRWSTQVAYFTGQMMKAMGREHDPDWQRKARAVVRRRFELYGAPATEAFMTEVVVRRPVGRLAPSDYERLKVAIARMARRLAQRHARRRRIRQAGRLDLRATLRANAGHDHLPFLLRWRQRRRNKPRIVAVCDVSGSVAAQVRFLLLFLYALHGTVLDLRSFAFSHSLVDVSEPMLALPFDDAMMQILREVGGGSTDYGQAWTDLHHEHLSSIDRRTTLLVLGDGRSNYGNPRLDLFADLAERAARVIWLCPERPASWGSGDSCMLEYRPWCTAALHCTSVADFERVIDDVLRVAD
jgi:uncharacterized protein with von Willebrand factor type A (vWA) domain